MAFSFGHALRVAWSAVLWTVGPWLCGYFMICALSGARVSRFPRDPLGKVHIYFQGLYLVTDPTSARDILAVSAIIGMTILIALSFQQASSVLK
jgi:hypothetical protein